MSEEQPQEIDKLGTHYARKGGPLTPEQRERKQQRFIKAYRETANIKYSCKVAGVNRQTFYNWRDGDEAFQSQLPDADADADDTLEYALYDRGVLGVPSYVVSQGRIVYEDIPDLDEAGHQRIDDKGKIITKRGDPLIERKYSDTLLLARLKARMPEKYKDKAQLEHTGKNGGPIDTFQVHVFLPDDVFQDEKKPS